MSESNDTTSEVEHLDQSEKPKTHDVETKTPIVNVKADDLSQRSFEEDSLEKSIDSIPGAVWLVMALATAERFSFYGMTAPLMNYMQHSRNDILQRGVLDWGEAKASQVSNVFYILTLLTPIGASLIADKHLGRFKVLCITFAIYLSGSVLLVISSLNATADCAVELFIISIILIAAGMSGVNGLLAAFVGDQYTTEDGAIVTNSKGKRIIADRGRTLESIYNIYYWCINVGGLAGIVTTELEHRVGFWAAFLLPTCALFVSAAILYLSHSRLTVVPAQKSALPDATKAMWLAARKGFSLDAATPDYQVMHNQSVVPWTSDFVDELKRALKACRMMLMAWPVLWLCRGQISNNLVAQAAMMQTSGVPNDMMYNTNPIVIILVLPLVDRVMLPRLRKAGIPMTAVTRLVIGFILEGAAMGMAAIVQRLIYNAGPCYSFPLQCAASADGTIPNRISVFVQLPIYALEACSEIFASPAGYELAFTMAPPSMKSLIQAIFASTGAMGSILSIAISPTYKNPDLIWVYASLSVAMGLVTLIFYLVWGRQRQSA